ncbi:MAG TPA: hypothetical protein DCS93_21775 [Microscillaceae bacterium]|nr:hypothetical protein [Microscillaceae bacterium]
MRQNPRKSTPKVKKGRVQKKNNHQETPNYWNTTQREVIVDKEKPGEGFRHYLTKQDVLDFIDLIPNWSIVSEDLKAIMLAFNNDGYDCWYEGGVIRICAWPKDLLISMSNGYFFDHKELFDRLDVRYTMKDHYLERPWYYEKLGEVHNPRKHAYNIVCEFTPNQSKSISVTTYLITSTREAL